MSRNRFRSQPTLQRSQEGGGSKGLVIGLGALAVLASGIYLALQQPTPAPSRDALLAGSQPQQLAGAPVVPTETAAVIPPAPAVAPEASLPAVPPPPVPAVAPPQRQSPPAQQVAVASPPPVARPAPANRPTPRPPQAAPDAEAYAEQLEAYELDERRAGYRWAQQHNVTVRRYCADTEQRTEAFMRGCLDYLRDASNG